MYISELITLEEIETWKMGDNILISSQTGTGKSYFIMNVLARFCKEHALKTLIFSNRDLLKQQNQKMALDNVDCVNYQFAEQLDDYRLAKMLSAYDVISFDECHYFFKDASFNANTSRVLEYALKKTNQIKLFISATPEPLYYTSLTFAKEYSLPRAYSFIKNLVFYDNISDVLEEIVHSPKKSVCFFSNARKAYEFAHENKSVAQFYCSKGNALYPFAAKNVQKEIVENECFSTKILATTTVLENGVNLVDSALENIVIDFYDPITIIQTLGRKRLSRK